MPHMIRAHYSNDGHNTNDVTDDHTARALLMESMSASALGRPASLVPALRSTAAELAPPAVTAPPLLPAEIRRSTASGMLCAQTECDGTEVSFVRENGQASQAQAVQRSIIQAEV